MRAADLAPDEREAMIDEAKRLLTAILEILRPLSAEVLTEEEPVAVQPPQSAAVKPIQPSKPKVRKGERMQNGNGNRYQ